MNSPLYRLVYISANEIKGDNKSIELEIKQILACAHEKNPQADLTGALLFNSTCFAQVLEGPHDNIQNTFERIQCDERHSHVVILAFEPAMERNFSQWSMAYLGADTGAANKFNKITEATEFDPARLKGDHVLELLKEHLLEAAH